MVEIVPTAIHPLRPGPVEIDDSRLQTLWSRHHRRNMWLAAAAGGTALLIGAALVVMAFRLNAQPPVVNVAAPVVNIPEQAAPVVNVTVPQQPAPVVNVDVKVPPAAVPPAQPQPLRTGESKVVTEHTIFHSVSVGTYTVVTGWKYRSSEDRSPYFQYCHVRLAPTRLLELAEDGKSTIIEANARAAGIDLSVAQRLANSCRWSG